MDAEALAAAEAAKAAAAATNGNDDLDDNGAGDAGVDEVEKDEQKKLVSLDRHKEVVGKLKSKVTDYETRLKAFEDADTERKKSEMSEVDRVKAEKAELEQRLVKFESEGKKQDALAKAKQAMAKDGKAIDPEKEDFLNRSLQKLAFNESSLDDDVAELAQLASIPKGSGHRSLAGKSSKTEDTDRDPTTYTGKELGEIMKESPDRYNAIMARRKQAIAAKAKAGK